MRFIHLNWGVILSIGLLMLLVSLFPEVVHILALGDGGPAAVLPSLWLPILAGAALHRILPIVLARAGERGMRPWAAILR